MPVGEENVRLLPGGAHGKPGAGPSDPPPGLPLRPQPVQMHHALPRRLHRLRLPVRARHQHPKEQEKNYDFFHHRVPFTTRAPQAPLKGELAGPRGLTEGLQQAVVVL